MNVIIYLLIAIVVIAIIVIIVRRLRPRGIAKEANKLRDLFLEKEDWERYLTGLGELEQQDDTRSKALHGSLRGGYQQRVAETIEEIAGVKSTLRRGLEDKQRIRQAYQIELERLAAKFKTGELPLQKYEASERKLRKKIELIEPDIKAIERLISAESSGEVKSYRGTATKKPFVPKTSARETRGAESLPEDEASVKRGGSSRLPKIMGIVGAIIVVAIITGLLLGREAPASIHPWPIYGHDAQWSFRSSYTGPEVPAVNWVIDLSDTTSQPLIGADGHIYFSEERDGILSIISLNLDGNTRSMMRVADESSYDDYGGLVFLAPGPTVAFYVLLDQQDGATVIALDAAYEELWRTHSEFFIYPPASKLGSDGTLYLAQVPDEDSRLARLEALRDDGTQKWTLALTDTASYVAIALHGTIYIYKEDGRVYAYDTDGRQSWRSNVLPGLPGNYAGCWLAIGPDDTLYVLAVPVDSSEYPMVCALTSSGHIKWHVDIQEVGVDLHFPAVGPDSEFYVHFGNKTLYMIDKEGQLVDFATIPGDFKSTILVDSANNVYACGSDYLYAFSSDGSLKWELPIAVDGSYLAMGSDGTIYVGGEDSEYEIKLYAISHALAK